MIFVIFLSLIFNVLAQNSKTLLHHNAQIFSSEDRSYLAITYENEPDWHTYWKNPGDAGIELKNEFNSWQPEELEWPTPKRYFEEGGLIGIGYSDRYSLIYKLSDQQISELKNKMLKIHSKWLICKNICIPGENRLQISWKDEQWQVNGATGKNWTEKELVSALKDLPQEETWPKELEAYLSLSENKQDLVLHYAQGGGHSLEHKLNLLTPFPQIPLDFKHEKLYRDKDGVIFGRMPIDWDGEYQEPALNLPEDGHFKKPLTIKFLYANPENKKFQIISKSFESFSVQGIGQIEQLYSNLTPIDPHQKDKTLHSDKPQTSFWYYLLLAFLGGLILNFMPCVLPVISIKLFGLIQHQKNSRRMIFKHNLFYSIGVCSTFLILGIFVIAIKSSGNEVGWGFQLQSPRFVALMIVFLFIFTLNLFGLFEFRTPGGRKLGGVRLEEGLIGDFLSGVLATVLSTPCSAPFLGTALTFAFTTGTYQIFFIFLSIGLGLSFPFLVTGIFPALVSFLPRPGHWMEHMKKFLGLTLIFTIIWLYDVLAALVPGTQVLMLFQAALALIFFTFYFSNHISKNRPLRFVFHLLAIFILTKFFTQDFTPVDGQKNTLLQEKVMEGLPWKQWSPNRLEELKKEKKLVFMDFTAKWCFTCKINEKLVLNTHGFRSLVEKYNVELLLADWTKRDALIGDWLKKHGHVGVPAYFIQNQQGEIISLGETISLKEIENSFKGL